MQLSNSHSSESSTNIPTIRLAAMRQHITQIFSGTSMFQRHNEPNSPKTPPARFGLRLLDHQRRRDAAPAMRSPTSTRSVIDPHSAPSMGTQFLSSSTANGPEPQPEQSRIPRVAANLFEQDTNRVEPSHRQNTLFDLGPRLVNIQRRRRRRHKGRPNRPTLSEAFRNKRVRSKAIQCIVLGFSLAVVLVIYLAVAVTNSNSDDQFHILLILIILILTIFFCHVFIRLCMLLLRPPKPQDQINDAPSRTGPGYMNPEMPIPITFARDEEIGEEEADEDPAKEALRPPPPAYGLWRGSVRLHPDLVHWERAHPTSSEPPTRRGPEEPRPITGNRPPSYASDNGIDYVIEAEPRSIAPREVLPVHPSERGRLGPLPED